MRIEATAADPAAARAAIQSLSSRGVDGRRIHLVDPRTGQPVQLQPDQTRRADRRLLGQLGSRLAVGALGGVALGGLVALVLTIVFDLPQGQQVAIVLLAALLTAAVGARVGALSLPVMAPAWEAANAADDGQQRLLVTEVDADELSRLRTALRPHVVGPVRLADGGARQAG